ncbi:hypothetical protein ACJX0J_037505, partial [Zea mays]
MDSSTEIIIDVGTIREIVYTNYWNIVEYQASGGGVWEMFNCLKKIINNVLGNCS